MSVELQEAEGRVKVARDAYDTACTRSVEAKRLAEASTDAALAKLDAETQTLRDLLARERKLLDDREARAFQLAAPQAVAGYACIGANYQNRGIFASNASLTTGTPLASEFDGREPSF